MNRAIEILEYELARARIHLKEALPQHEPEILASNVSEIEEALKVLRRTFLIDGRGITKPDEAIYIVKSFLNSVSDDYISDKDFDAINSLLKFAEVCQP